MLDVLVYMLSTWRDLTSSPPGSHLKCLDFFTTLWHTCVCVRVIVCVQVHMHKFPVSAGFLSSPIDHRETSPGGVWPQFFKFSRSGPAGVLVGTDIINK